MSGAATARLHHCGNRQNLRQARSDLPNMSRADEFGLGRAARGLAVQGGRALRRWCGRGAAAIAYRRAARVRWSVSRCAGPAFQRRVIGGFTQRTLGLADPAHRGMTMS